MSKYVISFFQAAAAVGRHDLVQWITSEDLSPARFQELMDTQMSFLCNPYSIRKGLKDQQNVYAGPAEDCVPRLQILFEQSYPFVQVTSSD